MNFYSATFETFRWFAARRRSSRTVERRTYVFILVPFHFNGNGRARPAEIAHSLIDDGSNNDAFSTLTALDCIEICPQTKTTGVREVNGEAELNYNLMWTWFLPNPLWQPKKRE